MQIDAELVSVIMATRNRAHSISKSIDSILNQTYKNIELIIVDDGSTDETQQVISSYSDERIRYFKEEKVGRSACRNFGIRNSRGAYIGFCDDDDLFSPEKIEMQIIFLEKNPQIDV